MSDDGYLMIRYTKNMVVLLSTVIDRVVMEPREKELLKNFVKAGGNIGIMPEWKIYHESLRQRVKDSISLLDKQLETYEEILEENGRLKRKLAIANSKQCLEEDMSIDSCEKDVDEDDMPISSVPMSKRLSNGLHSIGIMKISDLENHTWEEYKRIENVGAKTLEELKMLFKTYGLILRGEPIPTNPNQYSVDDLPYNRWVKEALKENDINTLADCAKYREDQLYAILGRKNIVKRIKNKLEKYGLQLKLYNFDLKTKTIIED